MGKIYHLDLKTLVEVLEGLSGILQRTLPKGLLNLQRPCLCSLYISHGQIIHCMLIGNDGEQIDARHMLPALYALEDWDVTLDVGPERFVVPPHPQKTAMPSPPASYPDELLIPYQIATVDGTFLSTLPRKDRVLVQVVLAQIDGIRRVVDINAQLSLSTNTIYQVINLLFQEGIIRFRRPGE